MTRSASILDNYPHYEATIGIEVHVQLTTQSKIFCSTDNAITNAPNKHLCLICAGYPGSLPTINEKVVDFAILTGLATNCSITRESSFDRKHYFYPDLPKGYQITQHFFPICTNGFVPITLDDGTIKKIRLARIHIEEDAGKNVHSDMSNESFVDLNRAGTPLLEIVSQPDISHADEAKAYLKALRSIVQYLGVCSGNMEEGAFRADTNVSVRKKGAHVLGTRAELKNINSFKYIGDAIEYELERQIEILEEGGTVRQETRLWDSKQRITLPMRSKEEAADYRYFNDPDLPLLCIDDAWIERIKKEVPELPFEKAERFKQAFGLSDYEAGILVEEKTLADYFETAYAITQNKQIVNWILRDVLGYIKEHNQTIVECKVTPEKLAAIVAMLEAGTINNHAAKEVFEAIAQMGADPHTIVQQRGLEQIGSEAELETIILTIINNNPTNVAQYQEASEDRKSRLIGFFVGQAMKDTKGKGNPHIIQALIKKHLG